MENYISLQKSQLLDSLENQVRFSQLVAVLVGEKGIGKSFTLDCLQSRLVDEVCIAQIDASIEIQEEQLRKVICMQLGLHSESVDSFEEIESSIRKNLKQKALISIDNAHLLSNQNLNSLLTLNQSQINHQESVLFLLLTGNESLPKNISFTDTFKKHQEMCVVFQLESIEKTEVASMVAAISHQELALVEEIYGDKQLDYFWQLSKGNPSELEYQVARWQSEQGEDIVEPVVEDERSTSYGKAILYFVVASFFIIILFYQDEINQLITPEKIVKDKIIEPKKQKTKLNSYSNKGVISSSDKKGKIKTLDKSVIQPVELTKKEKQKTNELKNIPQKNKTSADKDKSKLDNKIVKKSLQIPTIKEKAKPKENKIISNLSEDEKYLNSQPKSNYTLQWIGISKLANAEAFKNAHPLKSELYIYRRKQKNNQYLYLVVGGIYSSHQKASDAKNQHKKNGYKGNPWVKSLASIQNEIEQL